MYQVKKEGKEYIIYDHFTNLELSLSFDTEEEAYKNLSIILNNKLATTILENSRNASKKLQDESISP